MESCSKRVVIAGVIVAALAAAAIISVSVVLTRDGGSNPEKGTPPMAIEETYDRIDCYPEATWGLRPVTAQLCEEQGCTYQETPYPEVPSCYVSASSKRGAGYKVVGQNATISGDRIYLQPNDPSMYVGLFPNVILDVEYKTDSIVRLKFTNDLDNRYHVPDDILSINLPKNDARLLWRKELRYNFVVTNTNPFAFQIVRQSSNTPLWNTSVGGLVLADQFLSISTRFPSKNIYGFGENTHSSFRHDLNFQTWPMFSRDQWVGASHQNHYGVHPFYTCLEEDGNSHGVLLVNSNAMDYSLTPLPMITYRTIGGILDFYLFMGPTPENVIQQYTGAVGRPYMPPYWSLGFQLCRYGYNSLEKLQAAVNRTRDAGIPQDVQYADIDHYDERKVFTIDNVSFAGLPDYFKYLRDNGMRTIIILDPCLIANETNYRPYELVRAAEGYVRWPSVQSMPPADYAETNSTAMLGYVWPKGKVIFPDYFLNRTNEIWEDLIVEHYSSIEFDGLWIDMNEPANFGTNQDRPFNWPESALPYWSLKCNVSALDDPPYVTMAAYTYDEGGGEESGDRILGRLSDKTLCMIGTQKNGTYRHYDVHSLYGSSQVQPTLNGLRRAHGGTKRGLVVSRSTFVGGGRTAGHWLGDNFAEWKFLHESIIGMLEFNLFGIPYIGADICGFFNAPTTEMCKRWMQLGAFYPYSRNHNDANSGIEQDPGNFGPEVAAMSRDALLVRYALLPYLYTLFHQAHVHGNTVVRPLFHEYPFDNVTWGIDTQFLWGAALLVAPILNENQTNISFYLPKGRWYDFYTKEVLESSGGLWHSLAVVPTSKTPMYARGGFVLPSQDPARNTTYSRRNYFHLEVYLDQLDDSGGQAKGNLFWDDGESIDTYENKNYYYATYKCEKQTLRIRVEYNNVPEMNNLELMSVSIFGVNQRPAVIVLADSIEHYDFSYDLATKALVIDHLYSSMASSLEIAWRLAPLQSAAELSRIDCMPDGGDKYKCEGRGCTWSSASSSPDTPRCYLNNSIHGYSYRSMSSTPNNLTIALRKIQSNFTLFGNDILNVTMFIDYLSNNMLRIKMFDSDAQRYEVPVQLNVPSTSIANMQYIVEYNNNPNEPFWFRIRRRSTNAVIFDTSIGGFNFADQFLQIATLLPRYIYGFGENRHFTFRHDYSRKTWPMFSRDQPPGGDYANLYGVHPYYLGLDDVGPAMNSHGVLLLNSNAMEVHLQKTPALIYRTIGGILDFFVILGDSPEHVSMQYMSLIGKPFLPAYWALGFQLCRYGYENITNMKRAVARTIDANIPFDVQYGDIDHFEENKDFTWDRVRFNGLPEYIDELHSWGMKFITILDPAILGVDRSYAPFTTGESQDVYIRWPNNVNHNDFDRFNSTYMFGYVWPNGEAVFPDFFKNQTHQWWQFWINDHHNSIRFDGLWIDMNEPANFGTNEEKPFNWPAERPPWSLKCPTSRLDDPPYKPISIYGARLSEKTLCMVGLQTDGLKNFTEYDVHSLYGWSQTEPTLKGLQLTTGERGIVISRSTYPSSGSKAGHWLGDNNSIWSHMHDSIIGMLEFNLFGVPYIGADICGFFDNTTPELCQRWMLLGAFYPFSRNHNALGNIEQDPAVFGHEIAESSRKVLEIRYYLLPYLYTLFYKAHTEGATVVRSLMSEFTQDLFARTIDRQFLWGKELLVSPVLDQGQTTVDIYLPGGRWFDFYTGAQEPVTGQIVTKDAPYDYIPLHLREGYILPAQKPSNTTVYSRLNAFELIVIPDTTGSASGSLFWDDGVSIDSISVGNYSLYNFSYQNDVLSISTNKNSSSTHIPMLDGVRLLDWNVTIIGIEISDEANNVHPHSHYVYEPFFKELYLYNLSLPLHGVELWTIKIFPTTS